ncbi:MAG: RluA family pseudouridine synthase [Anaerolineae bacterium]|nr:RluA family pseudouridine synthase [Anaerolineae bacterium]
MPEPRIEIFVINAGGDRLDKMVSERFPELSRSNVQRLISEEMIRVNNQLVRASYTVRDGDSVSVVIPAARPVEIEPENLPLSILYEDASILVIDKAAGMVVHPGAGNPSGTLVNAVLAHCPDLKGVGGVLRPGIVHRLDKQTSGVIVVAKDDRSIRHLQSQFKSRTVSKQYIALVHGNLEQSNGVIEAPIGRHKIHRKRMAVTASGKVARTRWRVADRYQDTVHHLYTLVDVDLLTGRTHQIRVHFSWMGYPLVGDEVYGPAKSSCPAPRQFLHAAQLSLKHPDTGQEMTFTAPLPQDLLLVLQNLHSLTKTAL